MRIFKLIGIYDKKSNQIDSAVTFENYESAKDYDCELPDLLCFKQKSPSQISLNSLEIPDEAKRKLDSLEQGAVILCDAIMVQNDAIKNRPISPIDIKCIKIWNVQQYNEQNVLEKLTKVARYCQFQFHYISNPQFTMDHLDIVTFFDADKS